MIIVSQLDKIKKDLKSHKWYIRVAALCDVAKLPEESALSILEQVLAQEPDVFVRNVAVEILSSFYSVRVFKMLVSTLSDNNVLVSRTALWGLEYYNDPALISYLVPLAKDKKPRTRKLIALALSRFRNPQALELLKELVNDEDVDVAISAVFSLEKLNTPDAHAILIEVAQKTVGELRDCALIALRHLGISIPGENGETS